MSKALEHNVRTRPNLRNNLKNILIVFFNCNTKMAANNSWESYIISKLDEIEMNNNENELDIKAYMLDELLEVIDQIGLSYPEDVDEVDRMIRTECS